MRYLLKATVQVVCSCYKRESLRFLVLLKTAGCTSTQAQNVLQISNLFCSSKLLSGKPPMLSFAQDGWWRKFGHRRALVKGVLKVYFIQISDRVSLIAICKPILTMFSWSIKAKLYGYSAIVFNGTIVVILWRPSNLQWTQFSSFTRYGKQNCHDQNQLHFD